MDHTAMPRPNLATSLLRVVVGYRLFGFAWLTVLGIVSLAGSTDVARPEAVVAAIVGAGLWTALVVVLSVRSPEVLSRWSFVVVDTAVSAGTILAGQVAGGGGFAGGYPLGAVFHGVYAAGWAGGLGSAGALTLLALWQVATEDAADLTASSGAVLVYGFAAAAAAWAVATIRQRDALREAAEAALVAERTERARAEERAELAAQIHDGVLQTLALVQRNADDGPRVARLARRQERQLREVLYGTGARFADGFKSALTDVCAEVEDLTGVKVDLVVVGDTEPGPEIEAAVLAAREAVVNAAKHAGVEDVDVYGEVDGDHVSVFVRDRGCGFDPDEVAGDRRGIAESLRGRMAAVGGVVAITSVPGAGTEVKIEVGGGR
jgi:signal transduction histidine kinase